MSKERKLWRILAGRTEKKDGYEPRNMEWEFIVEGDTLNEALLKFDRLLSEFEYIKASAVVN